MTVVDAIDLDAATAVLMRSGLVRREDDARHLAAEIVLTALTGDRYDRDPEWRTPAQNALFAQTVGEA